MLMRSKRIGTLILAFLVGLGLFSVQEGKPVFAMSAADFKDVAAGYWGYSYIDFSAASGIINGYPSDDGAYRFLPENPVTREESMTMLYRALSAADQLKSPEDFSSEYTELFAENRIAGWAQKYVAYGLKYALITPDEISDFTGENGRGIAASREQVALWTAKAMGRNLSPAYSLIYVDKDSISSEKVPYVDLLYRQGIMQGDDLKMFRPDGNIKRVEFAAISSRVYESAAAGAYSADKEIQSYRGTVVSVDKNQNKIMMTQSDGTGRVIQVNPKTRIVINGKVNYNGLGGIETGSTAIIAWGAFYEQDDPHNETLQLHVITKTQTRTGLLTAVRKMDGGTSILEIENEDGDTILYVLDQNSLTEKEPQKGKQVSFLADGIKILELK